MTTEPDSFCQAFQKVQDLAATFAVGNKHHLSSGYQRQEARERGPRAPSTPSTQSDRDICYWKRRCKTVDRQSNELVCELYGLTDDEIVLVKGAGVQG